MIRKDVLMPPPLRCEDSRHLMFDAVSINNLLYKIASNSLWRNF